MVRNARRIRSVGALAVAVATMLAAASGPLAAAPGLAGAPPEQRAACTGDAFRLCSTEVPRFDQIIACLKKSRQNLTPACRAVVDLKG